MFEKYSSLLRSVLNIEGNSFCQQYPSYEKAKLFELRHTSGSSLLFSTARYSLRI